MTTEADKSAPTPALLVIALQSWAIRLKLDPEFQTPADLASRVLMSAAKLIEKQLGEIESMSTMLRLFTEELKRHPMSDEDAGALGDIELIRKVEAYHDIVEKE